MQKVTILAKAINKNKHPSSGVLPSRQQYRVYVYPGTPPPSVYQVTHGTALQAAERNVRHLSCEEGTHRSEVIVRSLRWRLILYCQGQLFCFVDFLSDSGQTRRMGRVRQGSSLTWLSIRIRLQGRKPGGSYKLFDLIVLPQDTIRPIRSIRGRIQTTCTAVPGG